MYKKVIVAGIVTLMSTSAMAETVTDHYKEIIEQVIEGQTPPMPSFEIDPQNMSNLLSYLHSLK